MPRNDPTDTGGLFVGRRPGTAPLRYRGTPAASTGRRRTFDSILAGAILVTETLLLISVWGPQPAGWLWVGSQVDYKTGSVELGITVAFLGMIATLMLTLVLAKQLDHVWKLVRRSAGHAQKEGMLERIFIVSVGIALVIFTVWFLFLEGPGPSLAPRD